MEHFQNYDMQIFMLAITSDSVFIHKTKANAHRSPLTCSNKKKKKCDITF